MGMLLKRTLVAVMLVLGAGVPVGTQTPVPAPPSASAAMVIEALCVAQDFQHRIDDYVWLHRLLEGPLPPLRVTTNMDDIRSAQRMLAARIRAARVNARRGDLITADVAHLFRMRIAGALPAEAWAAVLAEAMEDEQGRPIRRVPLRVNMEWPDDVPFTFVPPQLLAALPALPAELQYRIIGRSLVLWDHHANLIVDVFPDAFVGLT